MAAAPSVKRPLGEVATKALPSRDYGRKKIKNGIFSQSGRWDTWQHAAELYCTLYNHHEQQYISQGQVGPQVSKISALHGHNSSMNWPTQAQLGAECHLAVSMRHSVAPVAFHHGFQS